MNASWDYGKVFVIFEKKNSMNYLYILLTSVVLSFAGASTVPHAELEKAFNDNDAKTIVSLTKEKVLLTVVGSDGAFSQPQTKLILRGFFSKYPNGKFEFIFKGKESDGGSFSIGNYIVKDETFRVTFHFKKVEGDYKIETLIIER